jgi:hypothetical protein
MFRNRCKSVDQGFDFAFDRPLLWRIMSLHQPETLNPLLWRIMSYYIIYSNSYAVTKGHYVILHHVTAYLIPINNI